MARSSGRPRRRVPVGTFCRGFGAENPLDIPPVGLRRFGAFEDMRGDAALLERFVELDVQEAAARHRVAVTTEQDRLCGLTILPFSELCK